VSRSRRTVDSLPLHTMPISIGRPPARQSCLHNSGLWTLCFSEMCVPWDTRCKDGTFSSLPYIHSTRAIGAPFRRLFGGNCKNSRRECTIKLLRALEPGDYRSHFSSPTCSERRASRALWQMGPSLSIHSSAESSGIKAIPTCHRSIGPEL
jgi:hypothetical protein